MDGLMMDFPLTLNTILRRAETIHAEREVATRLGDGTWHRYRYADAVRRARKLAAALNHLGIQHGDRVATLCWNHYRHLEGYFAVPCCGAVLHTINPRLHEDDLAYIVNEARDRILIVDDALLPVLERFRQRISPEHIIVVSDGDDVPGDMLNYERLLEQSDLNEFEFPEPRENDAAAMCYTSGTTGKPKGVLYSHRAIALHTLVAALSSGFDVHETDCVLPVVPMFHVNAWGLPFIAAMIGTKLVLPGRHVDPDSLLDAFHSERVTITAGVPTVWIALLERLNRDPQAWDLSALRTVVVGGAAVPKILMQEFEQQHNILLVPAWGMTETTPIGCLSWPRPDQLSAPAEEQYALRTRQGRPVPFVEIRARGDNGLTAWDGRAMGELEVRGPWVAKAYYNRPDMADRFSEDGWFRTGDQGRILYETCQIADSREFFPKLIYKGFMFIL